MSWEANDIVAYLEKHPNVSLEDMPTDQFTLPELIKAQAQTRAIYENYKSVASYWAKIYDFLSIQLVPRTMEDMEISNIRLDGVGRVNVRDDMWTKTENPDALMEWLRERGLEDLITEGVNGSTLKALIKERIKKAEDIPEEDVVKITPYQRAVITKG